MVNYMPRTLQEALECRANETVVPYCGGTDLMVDAEMDVNYLFLHKIAEMKQIQETEEHIRFGAACTFTQIIAHPRCPELLREALLGIAAPAIRNFGTIGGNIANGSAKADSALIFFVTDSKIRLANKNGERTIPIQEFYLGRKKLDLYEDELIVEVIMPKNGLNNTYYQKIGGRQALAISRTAFAGVMDIEKDVIKNCAVAFGAVSDVIIRRGDIDAMLIGKTVDEAKAIKLDYLAAYEQAIVPIQGRVSKEYRKMVCMNLLKDFLAQYNI